MTKPSEVIILVDENNQIIGDIERHKMNFDRDFHRVTYILVFNKKRELLVQKRAIDKAFCPGFYGITTGGVVDKGESYLTAAQRELKEELGIVAPLQPQGVFKTEGKGFRIWGKIFTCEYDETQHGDIKIEKNELSSIHPMSQEYILQHQTDFDFTPDSLDALKHYVYKLTEPRFSDPS